MKQASRRAGLVAALLLAAPGWAFDWPVPTVIDNLDMPGLSSSNGAPVKLHAIRVKEKVEDLIQLYVSAFEKGGLFFDPRQKRRLAEPHLTAFDWRAGISYTVIFQPNPDGTTTCILGEANLKLRQRPATGNPLVFPGAKGVMQVQQESGQVLAYTVLAKAEDVEHFYRQKLARDGYSESEQNKGVFAKGNDELQWVIEPRKEGALGVVVIGRQRSEAVKPPSP